MSMSKKALFTTVGAGAVLAMGLAVPAVAFAEAAIDPAPSASASSSASGQSGTGGKSMPADREQRRAEHRTAMAEGLAKELGIAQDKVEAALEKVESGMRADAKTERQQRMKTRLDQAVKDGKLTQAQADAVRKAADSGVLPGGGLGGHRGPGGFGGGSR